VGLASSELGRIVQANVPVVCLDTCSVLDVIRDPSRDTSQPHDAVAAMALLQALQSGSGLVCLLADQVQIELGTHLQPVVAEAQRGLQKLRAHVSRVDGLVSAFGATVSTDLSPWDHHVAKSSNVVHQWIQASTVAPQSASVQSRAFSRVMRAQAPARKGKDSLQDCVVLETYLEAVDELRRNGLTSTVVFLSSNTNDYSESSTVKSQLHPELVPEFAARNMLYAIGHGMAKALLGL
jgi:PIN domain